MLRAAQGPASVGPPPAQSNSATMSASAAPVPGLVTPLVSTRGTGRSDERRHAGDPVVVVGDVERPLVGLVAGGPLHPGLVHPSGGVGTEARVGGEAAPRRQRLDRRLEGWQVVERAAA